MSQVLRIHQSGENQIVAWGTSKIIDDDQINSIPDAVEIGHADKMGTSIPSPFARMYLFETAFKIVKANGSYSGRSMYHLLVSDCLDMFHLLYLLGDDEKLTFAKWDRSQRIEILKNTGGKHRTLGNALEVFFEERRMQDLKEVYLIYYDGHLVGGTSPVTGLFTSPNWSRTCKAKGYVFKTPGASGDLLFDDDPCPIHEREEGFVDYIYAWIYTNQQYWSKQSDAFFKYFTGARTKYHHLDERLRASDIDTSIGGTYLDDKYDIIDFEIGGGRTEQLYTGPCALYQPTKEEASLIAKNSDFAILSTVPFHRKYTNEAGQLVSLNPPLVLTEKNHQMLYLQDTWDPQTVVDDEPQKPPLHKRKLPGFPNIIYPWITIGDFLTSELIQLPFAVDGSRFFTGFTGRWEYLLPVRKEYFQYFTVEDLKKQLSITIDDGGRIDVGLSIPVQGGSIALQRTYRKGTDTIRDLGEVNIGVFPFYRLMDNVTANEYYLGVATEMTTQAGAELRVYDTSKDGATTPLDSKKLLRSDGATTTEYVKVTKSFDLIELTVPEYSIPYVGIALPLMPEIQLNLLDEGAAYAVDFGTTNTHIMWKKSSTGTARDFERHDPQMVTLNHMIGYEEAKGNVIDENIKADRFNNAKIAFDREFVPSYLGDKSSYSFPSRTVLCESKGYREGNPILFGNTNIAFDFLTFYSSYAASRQDSYVTNIKWLFEQEGKGIAKERIEVYFREVLLLIRHHAIQQGNKPNTATIHWMVPDSMRRSQRENFEEAWQKAAQDIFKDFDRVPKLYEQSESIVPYYAIPNMQEGQSRINFDIGGGTTDVFIAFPRKSQYFTLSARFAGNDIWGDSVLNERERTKDNGFLELFDKHRVPQIEESDIAKSQAFRLYQENRQRAEDLDSSDLISLIFKYDDDLDLSTEIRSSPQLKALLLIHLAALVYQALRVLEEKDAAVPEVFSFTGMGSKYLRIVAKSERSWLEIIKTLVKVFAGEETARSVSRVVLEKSPKKMTATGALRAQERESKRINDNLDRLNYMGFKSTPERSAFTPHTIGQIAELEPLLMAEFDRFIAGLHDPTVKSLGKEMELSLQHGGYDIVDRVEALGKRDFETMAYIQRKNYDDNEDLEDMPFFWFLKGVFYELSKEIVGQMVRS